MKSRNILLFIPLLLISSCNKPVQNLSVVESFLKEARNGFTMNATSLNVVYNAITNEKLFENDKKYHYEFQNVDETKVYQEITYKKDNKLEKDHVSFKKSEDGFVSKEYLNYQNKVDSYVVGEDFGQTFLYDDLFLNPFTFIYEEDLIQDETNKNLYYLNEEKNDKFESYLIGKGQPTKEVSFLFNDETIEQIKIKSVDLTGKTNIPGTTNYTQANWNFVDTIKFKDIGTTKIESINPVEVKENKDLKETFNKVNDNFTLKVAVAAKGVAPTDETTQTLLVTKDACYLDSSQDANNDKKDLLYKKDSFKNDDLLYEYKKNEKTEKWMVTKNDTNSSYNLNPSKIDFFIPHLKDIDVSLFDKENGDVYSLTNKDALPYIGNAFLNDYFYTSYFAYGYGTGCSIKLDKAQEEIVIKLPFIAVIESSAYELEYTLTYSNIGKTTLPSNL